MVAKNTTDTLTNKSMSGTQNTFTNLPYTAFSAMTSAQLAGIVSDETGSGALVFANTPTLVTPVLGAATATSINKVAITAPATSATLTIADGKTLTASNTLTFTGTDGSSVALGAGGTVAYIANKLSVFAATTSAELAGVISDETGSGSLVFATSPTLTTPTINLGDGGTLDIVDSDTSVGTDELICAVNLKSSDTNNTSLVGAKLSAYSRNSTGTTTGFAIAASMAGTEKILLYSNANGTVAMVDGGTGNGTLFVENANATANATTYGIGVQYSGDTDCTGGYFVRCFNSSGTTVGRIEAASNTTTSFTGSSDERLKDNASDFNGLDILLKLKPREFEWKSNPGRRTKGFYAQELYQHYPDAVSVGDDTLTPDGTLANPWGVDYGRLTPLLVKAVQELTARVAELEANL